MIEFVSGENRKEARRFYGKPGFKKEKREAAGSICKRGNVEMERPVALQ